ncbi:hypothetical protein BRADI_2g12835v3 [Brachypodium distachyon]|uniref:Uncharacterized protein n=1 Tax=Brachypodium distachyon TaxID=15368 RepID=A0A2K2D882_BRADI|nr:hypothetical protein BRADI_2g12835v3 [Brachypodium distachyon]PNT70487.1 hypothetical protein BRADI_2g12835v3 [Brachypodium distachyon]
MGNLAPAFFSFLLPLRVDQTTVIRHQFLMHLSLPSHHGGRSLGFTQRPHRLHPAPIVRFPCGRMPALITRPRSQAVSSFWLPSVSFK